MEDKVKSSPSPGQTGDETKSQGSGPPVRPRRQRKPRFDPTKSKRKAMMHHWKMSQATADKNTRGDTGTSVNLQTRVGTGKGQTGSLDQRQPGMVGPVSDWPPYHTSAHQQGRPGSVPPMLEGHPRTAPPQQRQPGNGPWSDPLGRHLGG
eukprot:TRINITY_DN8941_c0_g1_i8.p1 TRINITY_DN8941_c0_g1~~TRINITY_DN8941_c0_g1_i8.p1  ORF type:complete len:150 (-),score=0.44 TRINITY_DN8941_c0_g1_i8:276-725(-)